MPNLTQSRAVLFAALALVVLVPLATVAFSPDRREERGDPWAHVPADPLHTDHAALVQGAFADGPAVTRACLSCHPESGTQMLRSAHFTWESPPVQVAGRDSAVVLGKKHALNNFCIGITGNWASCTSCHAGYGWKDESYDFGDEAQVDCLVCHDRTGTYAKTKAGLVAEGVDLVAVARSVGPSTRENCGGCHFRGGGGNAVKHGDLDETLYHPTERLDVHMGRHDFQCTTCHRSSAHELRGRSFTVSLDAANQVSCADCHAGAIHEDARLDAHTAAVACQTCHIPEFATDEPTKMHWDWSAAGQDLPESAHEYLKIKGRFRYEQRVQPEYAWYDGGATHYLLGDSMDPADTTAITAPTGSITDARARVFPFKVHRATQIYDVQYRRLIQPKTAGEGGYWSTFDWDAAARLGSAAAGQPYSGEYGFAPTKMYWPITHMVAPAARSLQCADCHGADAARLDWKALGYGGDPMVVGGRGNAEAGR